MKQTKNTQKNYFLVTLITSFSLSFLPLGCSSDGDEDEEETAEEIQARETARQTTAAASIMDELDASCGGSSCISASTSLHLAGESPLQTLRNFFFMAFGFPGTTDYENFHQGSADLQELVSEDGLIGRIEGIRSYVVDAIVANDTSITSCSDVPSTGSFEVAADSVTITFGTPVLSPAADWPKTGTYDKRILYSNSSSGRTAIFEFYCDYNGMMALIESEPNAGKKQYLGIFFDGETSNRHIEFNFFDDKNFDTSEEIYLMMNVRMNTETQTFQNWLSRSGLSTDSSYRGYRYVAHANYSTQQASFHRHDVSDGFTKAQYEALTGYDDTSVSTGVSPNEGEANDYKKGCAANFDTPRSSITTADTCSGLDLSSPPTPSIDSTGAMTLKWMTDSFKTRITSIE